LIISGAITIFLLMKKKKQKKSTNVGSRQIVSEISPVKQEIASYLRYNMQQGISIGALKRKLLEKGYDESTIDEIILNIEEEQKNNYRVRK
jgi:hypothetical protein